MILIALGANLPGRFGSPQAMLEAALQRLPGLGVFPLACSAWYETAPVPASDQPNYVNAVALVDSIHDAEGTLRVLHAVEDDFGRVRAERNAARVVDLDLIDFHGEVREAAPILPHPRMHERAFVLVPLKDVAPEWRHPVLDRDVATLIAALPGGQAIRRIGG
jgi:2-amino-4-hydroxy-6-hydroxymethyldihydropteridine diphosphokinase